MNTQLEKLLDKYKFSDKDRFEIRQIFFLLTEHRKKTFLNNFSDFALTVQKINSDIEIEKEILIWDAVERIIQSILKERKEKIDFMTKKDIKSLKNKI